MMLLLLVVLLLNRLLLHGEVPRGLTLLLAAVVQNAVQMRRHILIGDHLVLKGVPHQQIAGLLITGFGAVRQDIFLRENVHGAAVDSQPWPFEDPSLGRFRRQRR